MDMKLVAQAAIMLATIAGGYAVVKAQLARVMSDLEDFIKRTEDHKSKFDARLDDAESQRAVFASRIDVLADINSVKALAELNTRLAKLEMGQEILFKEMEVQKKLHNGSHPRTDA
jgi:hypothetical protein